MVYLALTIIAICLRKTADSISDENAGDEDRMKGFIAFASYGVPLPELGHLLFFVTAV